MGHLRSPLRSCTWHWPGYPTTGGDWLAGGGTSSPCTWPILLRSTEAPKEAEAGLPVDMLSPGDMPSSTGCSVDCGLEAERFIVGGCGGGRVGLCRGLGVGRDLVKVLVKLEGEARGGAAAAGESWPEAKGYP